ncbi:hypothetical protein H6P81_006807 [Aristolochia fimbriata]|uniref:Uncharacterized protein n=1 Tax=Aristolochia fimbriata TaxID=158543 RepID=A0AAV7F2W6_ARIFI|nr:hypothetical protein H6P81_006807 [Aristolochia fimbriata]
MDILIREREKSTPAAGNRGGGGGGGIFHAGGESPFVIAVHELVDRNICNILCNLGAGSGGDATTKRVAVNPNSNILQGGFGELRKKRRRVRNRYITNTGRRPEFITLARCREYEAMGLAGLRKNSQLVFLTFLSSFSASPLLQ